MIKTTTLTVDNKKLCGLVVDLPKAPLVAIIAPKGYLMCGYLNIATAEKLGQAAAVVRGVKSVEDALNKKISAVTKQARKLGIKRGMLVREALKKLV
ncbi:MAG: hypothetical protein APZ16_02075 [Candidatus Hadarchaeum yellowstonense]|jgi:uncharacterized protein YunC (DUF1805 family)|uniref:DUF1805 domain-containing protein n=1 Tax=Hadarchaeum yellowstonense TaxID=1776334 RepID=A0A147K150_HADYE|nr:MAG: hypothetical protein APZ16_02075 [Candidatus Hadarchaeum yellowstonense]